MSVRKYLSADDRAVSPVIGVILMVAITVILAAVIGTFVLDLGNNAVQQNPQAGVSVEENGNTVTITVNSMPNADSVSISRSDQSGYGATMSTVGDSVTVGDATGQSSESFATGVGTDDVALASGAKVTVTATYKGNTVVIASHTN